MKKVLCFFLFISSIYGMDHSIPSGEDIFRDFLSDLFQHTTAGYVIFGHKPLDLDGFDSLRSHIPGSNLHRRSVLGLLCQAFLCDMCTKDDWIFTIQQPIHPDTYELLIAKRSALAEKINAHLELFKLKFGFNINPQKLLDQLQQSGFGALFGGEIALQGIMLGYGYENAISYERLVKCRHQKSNEFNDFANYTPTGPSDHTMVPFVYHLKLPNNQKLIRLYQQDQKTVESTLRNPNWIKHFFLACFKKPPKLKSIASKKLSIPDEIAQSIRESCSIYFSPQFIQGMRIAEEGKLLTEPDEFIYFNYFYRDDFFTETGRDNRIFSDCFFETDKTSKTMLIPRRLAIRILKGGTDETQTVIYPQDSLLLYTIKTLEGEIIGGSFYLQEPAPIPEKDLFPGLAYGVLGMHPGEEREIFVHPDLFYGTSFRHGKPIVIRVFCKSVLQSTPDSRLPSLLPIKMQHTPLSITTAEQFSAIQSKIQEWVGWQVWMHYKYSASLKEILQLLEVDSYFSQEKTLQIKNNSPSKKEIDTLLFEWKLYKQKKPQAQRLQMHKLKDESPLKSLSRQNHVEELSAKCEAQK